MGTWNYRHPQDPGVTLDASQPIRPVPALVTEPATPAPDGQQRPRGGRVVLRDHEGRVVDVDDPGATPAEIDQRARQLMTWLRRPTDMADVTAPVRFIVCGPVHEIKVWRRREGLRPGDVVPVSTTNAYALRGCRGRYRLVVLESWRPVLRVRRAIEHDLGIIAAKGGQVEGWPL